MDNIILHCDLNNFFASVECLDRSDLKGKPVAVCGSVEDRHGIVLAKNDIAKKTGIQTGEVIWQAKMKCPDLVIVPPNMDKYINFSKRAREVYYNYTDLIEPFGIDECWLDVTGSQMLFGNGYEIAYKIKEEIKKELRLTISVGVSFNKIFAKLGSDLKKPDEITCITKENFKDIVWRLPANELLGVGRSTYKTLLKYGINTIGDMANTDISFLKSILGKNGEPLYYFANGKDLSKVTNKDANSIIKSIGNSTTCSEDLLNEEEVYKIMYHLAESVTKRLRKNQLLATGVQISIKDNYLSVKEMQSSLRFASRYPKDLADIGISLFHKNYKWENNVRAVGIRAIHLISEKENIQYSLLYNQNKINELESLENKVCSLRERYGESSILRASLMEYFKSTKRNSFDESSLPTSIFKN